MICYFVPMKIFTTCTCFYLFARPRSSHAVQGRGYESWWERYVLVQGKSKIIMLRKVFQTTKG